MGEEMWLPITGFAGRYEVSNLGRVRSVDHTIIYRQWRPYERESITIEKPIKGKILSPGTSTSGHLSVVLGRGNTKSVHRLVLETFVGPCPEGMECCHNNGDPTDNRVDNLRWDTRSSNILDAVKHGSKPTKERAWNAILTEQQVAEIRVRLREEKGTRIAKDYGVSEGAIYMIRAGRSWKGVG